MNDDLEKMVERHRNDAYSQGLGHGVMAAGTIFIVFTLIMKVGGWICTQH